MSRSRSRRALTPIGLLVGLILLVAAGTFFLGALTPFGFNYGAPLVVPWMLQLLAAIGTAFLGLLVIWFV